MKNNTGRIENDPAFSFIEIVSRRIRYLSRGKFIVEKKARQ